MLVKFRGELATGYARQYLLFPEELKEALEADTDPYVGDVPPALLREAGISRERFLQFLEQFAEAARKERSRRGLFPSPATGALFRARHAEQLNRLLTEKLEALKPAGMPWMVRYVDEGAYGMVLRLAVGKEQVAFKVFHGKDLTLHDIAMNMPFEEAAVGAHLTAKNISDLTPFYLGNPAKGWLLAKFIDDNTSQPNWAGNTLSRKSLAFKDEVSHNRVNGYRVDYGCFDYLSYYQGRERHVPAFDVYAEERQNSRFQDFPFLRRVNTGINRLKNLYG